jgi:SEC-C motif-containing protein
VLLPNKSLQIDCLCGSAQTYDICCFPFHNGESTPETAEKLMRSRYVAYAKQLAPYLLQTWCATERPDQIEFDPTIRWKELTIQSKKKGRKKDREGWVTFTATYQVGFECLLLKEKSFFSRDKDHHWCYVSGVLFSE